MKKKTTSRIRRRLLRQAFTKSERNQEPFESEPATPELSESPKEVTEPADAPLSFQLTSSHRAVRYQPHRAKNVQFRDPRGNPYEISEQGELRALLKPRSRVKRLREERRRKETKTATDGQQKEKETDQEKGTTSLPDRPQ